MAKVAIIMGSKSDMGVMEPAAATLKEFGIKHQLKVISAHRSPDELVKYVKEAGGKGVEVFIAGAGKAAHLPGVIAAHTSAPVIGVPVKTSDLGGMDSLLSIVQMPSGVPVATVAINGAKNAALLSIQMLALKDNALKERLDDYKKELAAKKDAKKKSGQEYEEPIIDG